MLEISLFRAMLAFTSCPFSPVNLAFPLDIVIISFGRGPGRAVRGPLLSPMFDMLRFIGSYDFDELCCLLCSLF